MGVEDREAVADPRRGPGAVVQNGGLHGHVLAVGDGNLVDPLDVDQGVQPVLVVTGQQRRGVLGQAAGEVAGAAMVAGWLPGGAVASGG